MCSTIANNAKANSLVIAEMQCELLHSRISEITMNLVECEVLNEQLSRLNCYGNLVSICEIYLLFPLNF